MPPTRTIWPRYTIAVWGLIVVVGIFLAVVIPLMRPVLVQCAWVIVFMPVAAGAGQAMIHARQHETPNQFSGTALGYRVAALGLALGVICMWWKFVMAATNAETLSLIGTLLPVAQLVMIAPLALAFMAGVADQRDENRLWAHNFLRQFARLTHQ